MSKKKSGSFFGSILVLAAIVLGVVAVLLFALLPNKIISKIINC